MADHKPQCRGKVCPLRKWTSLVRISRVIWEKKTKPNQTKNILIQPRFLVNLLFLRCGQLKSKWCTSMKYIVRVILYKKMACCFRGDAWVLRASQKKSLEESISSMLYFLIPWHSFHSVKLRPQRNFESVLCLFGLTVLLFHDFSKYPWPSSCTWSWFEIQSRQRFWVQEIQSRADSK